MVGITNTNTIVNCILTDRLLVDRLAEHRPWITQINEKTSGYIHLSDIHLSNTMGKLPGEQRLTVITCDRDTFITEAKRAEAV